MAHPRSSESRQWFVCIGLAGAIFCASLAGHAAFDTDSVLPQAPLSCSLNRAAMRLHLDLLPGSRTALSIATWALSLMADNDSCDSHGDRAA